MAFVAISDQRLRAVVGVQRTILGVSMTQAALFDGFAVVGPCGTAGENFVTEGILRPCVAATVTFMCVVVKPGARTAAVAWGAPAKRTLASCLLLLNGR